FAPDAFIRLNTAGKVTVVVPVIEMGQGTYTSLPMLIAEEMHLDMANVGFEHAPPAKEYYNPAIGIQITGGSTSVRGFFMPFRHAGPVPRKIAMKAGGR